jgi:hypothetical protein
MSIDTQRPDGPKILLRRQKTAKIRRKQGYRCRGQSTVKVW